MIIQDMNSVPQSSTLQI